MLANTLEGTEYRQSSRERVFDQASENKALAAAIELQSELDDADRLDDAAQVLAERLSQIFKAERLIVLWRTGPHRLLRLVGDSKPFHKVASIDSPNQKLEEEMAVAAGEELAILDETLLWVSDSQQRRVGGTLAIEQLAKSINSRVLVASNLCHDNQPANGTVLVINPKSDSVVRFLEAVGPLLTSRLTAIERMQPGRVETAWRCVVESVTLNSHGRNLVIGLIAFLALMAMPATYTISVPLELQPVTRRYVAVPFDGPLKTCHVRPGDVVAQGELLAEIDPREIEYELAGVRSQWEQAEQTRKSSIAEHDFAAGQIAQWETQRLESHSEMLAQRQTKLEIRSPVAGMIVSGDWRSSEGMPLSRGETLFEVAPLDTMVVHLWIPEPEIAHVREDMTVKFATHSAPDHIRVGKIRHLHPKAEIQEHKNVFIAEVRIENSNGRMQPGMRGYATIYAETKSIGWNWFHRPWYALCDLVRW